VASASEHATAPNGGMSHWLGEPVDAWRERWGLPLLQIHPSVTSTNDHARRLADQGAPHGTVVMAEEQTRGRGRRGREWTAPAGSSLLLSMVLRPRDHGAETLLSLRLGLAAARAMEAVTRLDVGVKWPNDLVVDDLKVGGILCEGAREAGRPLHMVAGIGLNLSQRDDDWPHELRGLATSLEARAGAPVPRPELVDRLVGEWLGSAGRDDARLDRHELDEFRRRDTLRGRSLAVDGIPAGVGQGIESDGALLVGPPGAPRRIINGTIRTLDAQQGATP
jgi:BirA family transcriptional regulator, biotin operon repressor / biotin---[acetyl-CoA-carboxylase] ligase